MQRRGQIRARRTARHRITRCGTAVITSGVSSVNTSPSMPTFKCERDDCTRMRSVRNERKPGIVRTRPAR